MNWLDFALGVGIGFWLATEFWAWAVRRHGAVALVDRKDIL